MKFPKEITGSETVGSILYIHSESHTEKRPRRLNFHLPLSDGFTGIFEPIISDPITSFGNLVYYVVTTPG